LDGVTLPIKTESETLQPIGAFLDDLQDFQAYLLQAQNGNAVLLAVAELRLLDDLDEGPATAAGIAASHGLNANHVWRVLRFLVAQQIIEQDETGRFRHTHRSILLQKHMSGLQFLREAMGAAQGLAQCLRTGKPAFDCHFGEPVFDYLRERPDALKYFGDLMSRTTTIVEDFVLTHHEFEPFELAVDVGGNHGQLLIALLGKYSNAQGIVFDLPETARQATTRIAETALADRIETQGGDFFRAVPAGGDLYLLKQILHDWDDDECLGILSSIRRSIAQHGRLAVIEYLLPEAHIHHAGFSMDIHMMVLSSGRERTLAEYVALFEAANFRLDRVTENPRGLSVAVAVPD
jgi:hypothetical protein